MVKFSISGNIIDLFVRRIFPGTVLVDNGIISGVSEDKSAKYDNYIMPGFIDAHVHIESSMLVPSEFARVAVCHGTVGTVSDPHEIANVVGINGIRFMLENGSQVPFNFHFGASSCVPATAFETSGATISADDIRSMFNSGRIKYLSEMMNFPGVIYDFPDVLEKLAIAREFGYPIDGHAPGLRGNNLRKYVEAGITTDHESFTLEEAKEKILLGMKILIRNGSAAKNFEALHPLLGSDPGMCMLSSDDIHPNDLVKGHINLMVKRAVELGYDLFDVLCAACINPVFHYKLGIGMLRVGDDADFIVVDNINDFNPQKVYIKGICVADNGKALFDKVAIEPVNKFNIGSINHEDFAVKAKGGNIRVIEAIDGEIVTNEIEISEKSQNGFLITDLENDILKIAVINRYEKTKPSVGFIKNFGLKSGAIATSVGHDSHNIIAVGVDDHFIAAAVNEVIKYKGGMAVYDGINVSGLPSPVGGLMSDRDAYLVSEKYSKVEQEAKSLGSGLASPFMTLSFMALLVIPKLKLGDKGLFDGEKFEFKDLYC